jgi:hypothetical protein
MYSVQRSDLYLENSKVDVSYGIYIKQWMADVFFKHSGSVEAFYGARYTGVDGKGKPTSGHFGEYVWNYQNENASHWQVRSAIQDLARKTGLNELMMVNIPSQENLEYAGVFFHMSIPDTVTDRLSAMATSRSSDGFVEAVVKSVEQYFGSNEDENDVCADYSGDLDRCRDEMIRNSRAAAKKMWKSLQVMAEQKGNPEAFSRAYGEYGHAMSENQFTFQAGLQIAGAGVELSYRLEGAAFEQYELGFVTDESGSLKTVNAPAGSRWKMEQSLPLSGISHVVVLPGGGPVIPIFN